MGHRIRANFSLMQSFMDRVVLITGASGGLGTAVTRAFLTAGASVIGVARSLEAAPNLGPCFMPQPGDLSLPAGAEETVAAAFARTGRIDCLVHLMGGFAGGQPVAQTTDETWTRMMDTNLNSAFRVARAVLPKMLAAGYGRMVTVGSRTAVEPAAGLSAYAVAKAGLVALTRTIAAEVKGTGVTANIEPGGQCDGRSCGLGQTGIHCGTDPLAGLYRSGRCERGGHPDLRLGVSAMLPKAEHRRAAVIGLLNTPELVLSGRSETFGAIQITV
jgi:NAD(P)-dependent dehydrogenase (short-subunit alcohol dehydrogenase family)